jgi:hypothetical protein
LQQKKKKNPEPFASSSIFFILLWFSWLELTFNNN